MPTYKLHYFNFRGRGEIVRLVFAQAGVEYEDIRFEMDQWPAEKEKTPFGQCPYIEVDGKPLAQGLACARYIAREHAPGLMGKNAWEEAQINCITDTFADVFVHVAKVYFAKDEESKNEAKEKAKQFITTLEKCLRKNNEGTGYFVGDSVTLADLQAFCVMESLFKMRPEAREKATMLAGLVDRVAALPNIRAWLDKRPDTAI